MSTAKEPVAFTDGVAFTRCAHIGVCVCVCVCCLEGTLSGLV